MAILRCPRCRGFMFDAIHWYRYTTLYRNKKHCINCGRNWELIAGQMREFPERRNSNGRGNSNNRISSSAVSTFDTIFNRGRR